MKIVRKTLAVAGLLALGLIGYQLMTSQLDLVDAAQRATAVMFALMLLQWITRLAVTSYLKNLETQASSASSGGPGPGSREEISLQRD